MPPPGRTSRPRPRAALLVAAAILLGTGACGGGAGIGERCGDHSACASGLQCLDNICVPRCETHADCGDGHICRPDGICEVVETMVGDYCQREIDCGPGQTCQLNPAIIDEEGFMDGECALEESGGVLDDACTGETQEEADAACRSGTCALGRCVYLCVATEDCPESHACSSIPRQLDTPNTFASFHGCLPDRGTLTYRVPTDEPFETFMLPWPGVARSVAMVASVDDASVLVGAAALRGPDGEVLYTVPLDREEYFANRIRHQLAPGVSTLLMPQTPDDPLGPGAYVVDVGSYLDPMTAGNEVPAIEIIYKLDSSAHLDLHFHFLDLTSHPCRAGLDGVEDALSARTAPAFQDVFLGRLNGIFANAGVILERQSATYDDILDRHDLDGLDISRLGDLLELSEDDGGVHVFFVRSISPSGIEGLAGGPPAPPGLAGTRASGVAIALDTLCYEDWEYLARTTAHEIARALGLERSVEPDGHEDAISDSDYATTNLMYFADREGSTLSPSQRAILRANPVMR
jgi:hypothetical protein